MSEPLQRLDPKDYAQDPNINRDLRLMLALNAAIERINELEAKYEGHEHDHLAVTSDTEALVTSNPKENER